MQFILVFAGISFFLHPVPFTKIISREIIPQPLWSTYPSVQEIMAEHKRPSLFYQGRLLRMISLIAKDY